MSLYDRVFCEDGPGGPLSGTVWANPNQAAKYKQDQFTPESRAAFNAKAQAKGGDAYDDLWKRPAHELGTPTDPNALRRGGKVRRI